VTAHYKLYTLQLGYPVPPLAGDASHLTYPVPAQCATPRLPVPPLAGDASHLTYPVPAQCATPRLPGASSVCHASVTRCQLSVPRLGYPVPAQLPGPRLGYLVPAIILPGRDTRPQLAYPVPYSAENVLRAIWPGLPCLPGESPRVCPLLSLPALPHGTRPHNSLTLCASLPCSHLTYLVPAPGYLVDLRPTAPLGSPEPSPTILV
jgi:hypothetical protein